MDDLKAVIAQNIIDLRHARGMTQAGLAEILNYSDKAVSKWERKESLPDITVLKAIADCFGVTVDYLITSDHAVQAADEVPEKHEDTKVRTHGFVTGMSIMLVWLIAAMAFVIVNAADKESSAHWLAFVYAIPVSMIVWLVLNSIWFNNRRNYIIISGMMWSLLVSVFFTMLICGSCYPLIFILGIPGQAIIFLWSRINHSRS